MAPRINPCSYLPRRLQVVVSLTAFTLFCIIFLGTSNANDYDPYLEKVPFGPQLQSGTHQAVNGAHQIFDQLPHNIPSVGSLNFFKPPAHKPPEQANSTSGETRWLADFKWIIPFSSSVTLDEERTVLPHVQRTTIHTYFDSSDRKKDETSTRAEKDLLEIWQRAWWAQGFKPVVLGIEDAKQHPMWPVVQKLDVTPEMALELRRWLAWGHMKAGILSNWLAVPMTSHDDVMLAFLRRAEFPTLTRYEGLGNGLFVGNVVEVEKALKAVIQVLDSRDAKPDLRTTVKNMADAVPNALVKFASDSKHSAIAFYGSEMIKAKYSEIQKKLEANETRADGLAMLPTLINSHLHLTWQNLFHSGIAVLRPLPKHTSSLVEAATELGKRLSQCPKSDIPTSCPPNRPKCKPCVSSKPLVVSTPAVYRNSSSQFTIATVPHPYTLISLVHSRAELSVGFVRRETQRDAWISAATKELLGGNIPGYACLLSVKDAVATPLGASRSLWLTAERLPSNSSEQDMEDLDWKFGFKLPRDAPNTGKSKTPVPGKAKWLEEEPDEDFIPTEDQLVKERNYLELSRRFLESSEKGTNKPAQKTRNYVEAWNLADTEAWKFVRAFNARSRVERRAWWDEEEKFQDGSTIGRWMDKFTRQLTDAAE